MIAIAAAALGVVSGLRTLVPPAVVAWAAQLGFLDLSASALSFLAHPISPIVFTVLLAAELVVDKLPSTPSRTTPFQLSSRLASGVFCGAALAVASATSVVACAILAALGALVGAVAGRAMRRASSRRLGMDLPIALAEDAVAILAAVAFVLVAA